MEERQVLHVVWDQTVIGHAHDQPCSQRDPLVGVPNIEMLAIRRMDSERHEWLLASEGEDVGWTHRK